MDKRSRVLLAFQYYTSIIHLTDPCHGKYWVIQIMDLVIVYLCTRAQGLDLQ